MTQEAIRKETYHPMPPLSPPPLLLSADVTHFNILVSFMKADEISTCLFDPLAHPFVTPTGTCYLCTVHGRLAPCRLFVLPAMSVFCVHLVIYRAIAAAGIAKSLQLSSFLPGQAVSYTSWQAVPTVHRSTNQFPFNPLLQAKLDRTPCWVDSLQPSASVVKPHRYVTLYLGRPDQNRPNSECR
jgi:hypothetical protein